MALPSSFAKDTLISPQLTGIVLNIVPGDIAYNVEIQRTSESGAGGAASTAAVSIALLSPIPEAGQTYYDYLPRDGANRYYRARHTADFVDPGSWTSFTTGHQPTQLGEEEMLTGVSMLSVYPVKRDRAMDDGKYAVVASSAGGLTIDATVQESGGKLVNRLYAKVAAADPDTLDSVVDGTTYARILSSKLSTGVLKRSGTMDDGKYAFLANNAAGTAVPADIYVASTALINVGTTGTPGSITKSRRFSPSFFMPVNQATAWSLGAYRLGVLSGTTEVNQWHGAITMPVGVTLTEISARLERDSTAQQAELSFSRITTETGATSLAVLTHATCGIATVTSALSELVATSSYSYVATLTLARATTAGGFLTGIYALDLTFTMPDYSKS